MSERNDEKGKRSEARRLEPLAGRAHGGQPMRDRLRPVAEPAPKQPSRLFYLPPIWTRASFWFPLGRAALTLPTPEPSETDTQDDFAA
jgi:hypothetical protein